MYLVHGLQGNTRRADVIRERPPDSRPTAPFMAPMHYGRVSAIGDVVGPNPGGRAAHGVPPSTITKIANRCLKANEHGHTKYVYLTDLEDECAFQGTVHLVAYVEPADALPEHYHHIRTVMERASLTWWYESLLESALRQEWPRAAARGLVRDEHLPARQAEPPTKANINQVACDLREYLDLGRPRDCPNICYEIKGGRMVLSVLHARPDPDSDLKLLYTGHRRYPNREVSKCLDDIYRELRAAGVCS